METASLKRHRKLGIFPCKEVTQSWTFKSLSREDCKVKVYLIYRRSSKLLWVQVSESLEREGGEEERRGLGRVLMHQNKNNQNKNQNKRLKWEMANSTRFLLCTPEKLSSDAHHACTKPGTAAQL